MAVVVVHKPQGVVRIFAGETERIVCAEIVVRRSPATNRGGDCTKGSVLIMRRDTSAAGEEYEVRDVLVSGLLPNAKTPSLTRSS